MYPFFCFITNLYLCLMHLMYYLFEKDNENFIEINSKMGCKVCTCAVKEYIYSLKTHPLYSAAYKSLNFY